MKNPLYRVYTELTERMKNKKIAILLSLLFPGLGHLYTGQYADAAVFIAGAGILWYVLLTRGEFLRVNAAPRFYLILLALFSIYLLCFLNVYKKTK